MATPSRPADLSFDVELVADLALAVRRARDALNAAVVDRRRAAERASATWIGGYRDRFDADLVALDRSTARALAALEGLSRSVSGVIADAEDAAARRRRSQAEWDAEQANGSVGDAPVATAGAR